MEILHVDTERGFRGGQAQLLYLARATRHRCGIALPPDAQLASRLSAEGIASFSVPFRGRLGGGRALGRWIEQLSPALVAAHTSHAAAHLDRLGIRAVVHRRLDFPPSRAGRRRLDRCLGIVAVSGAVARILRCGGIHAPISVVYDGIGEQAPGRGVDPRSLLGLAPGTPLVVAIGALVPHKGHRHLVDALALLPGVHVAILGQGPLWSALLRRARALGIGARLHLCGQRDDVGDWLAGCDVVCHPSVEEGLGQSVIEALLAGCAVVATRAGGIPEVVEGLGILVPPRRSAPLARALRCALAQPGALRRGARRARGELLHRFGIEAMVEGTERAYARFLG
ncbi:MAG TPA: glycosyltransferase [Deltaproteobacteria bacterium]|nr:glycosyltransferase [Deltaproteobacteria bacterium]